VLTDMFGGTPSNLAISIMGQAEQLAHGLQERLGDLGALKYRSHEDEQRHGDQHLVGHQAEIA
jgi:hypothetical protein